MNKRDVSKFFESRLIARKTTLETVWKARLDRVVTGIRVGDHGGMQKLVDCYVEESEKRQSEIKRMILLFVADLHDSELNDVIEAADDVLAYWIRLITDGINNAFLQYLVYIQLAEKGNVGKAYLDAKCEAAIVWNGLDVREKAAEILKKRDLLDASIKSLVASIKSAEANEQAAKAARTTAIWTRAMMVATAVAAIATAVSAYYTAKGASDSQRDLVPTQPLSQSKGSDTSKSLPIDAPVHGSSSCAKTG